MSNEFRFSTKQGSLGTGLIDFGYRWYDPATGRWTRRDPSGLDEGVNLYAYCFSQPLSSIDPDGLRARTVVGAANELVAYSGGGALAGSTFGPAGAVVGGIIGAGLWALQQFGSDDDNYIEDMSPIEAVGALVTDFCYGAVGGYLGGYAYSTLRAAYAYYTLMWGGTATLAASSGPPLLPRSLQGGPRDVSVYYGVRGDQPVYVGVTNNLTRRQLEWGTKFTLKPMTGAENLTRTQARAVEQVLIEQNPHFENKINSIAPSNPIYNDAVQWGRDMLDWLSKVGGG